MSDNDIKYYHGTSIASALSIQRSGGFSLAFCGSQSGTLLGDGVYYTGNLTKALAYAKMHEACGVILVLRVDMGNCKVLSPHDPMMRTWHENGYHTAHAPHGPSGCGGMSEYCVRDPKRISIVGVIAGDTDQLSGKNMEIRDNQLVHLWSVDKKQKNENGPPFDVGFDMHTNMTTSQPSIVSRPLPPVVLASSDSKKIFTPHLLKSFEELSTIPFLPLPDDQVERFCVVWSCDECFKGLVQTKGATRGADIQTTRGGSSIQPELVYQQCGLPTFGLGLHGSIALSDYQIFQESTSKESAERTKHASCTISANCELKMANMCTLEMIVPPGLQNQWVDLAMTDTGDVYRGKTGPFVVLSFETLHLLNKTMTREAANMRWNFTVCMNSDEAEVDVMGGYKKMPPGQNYETYIDDDNSRGPFMIKTTTANTVDADGNIVSKTAMHDVPCPDAPSQTMTTCVKSDGPAVQKGHFDLFRFVFRTANTNP